MTDRQQTSDSFGYKWRRRDSYGSEGQRSVARNWLIERYGFGDAESMTRYFASRERLLDAGCGGGYSAAILLESIRDLRYVGVDISEAVWVARERLAHLSHARFVQSDLMSLPFGRDSFDTILSEGVLHHTPSTRDALRSVASHLAHGGEILFYVYRRKGPVREFSDDHIRDRVASLPPEEAWEAMRPLTSLARALAESGATVTVDDDVPLLGIKAGRYDVQRLIYGAFCKLFWNDAFTFEENLHVNFDWYHPRYAHRQTEDDVRTWCEELGLRITHMDVQESGITTRAVRD
jgi:arsenite methyltransferase